MKYFLFLLLFLNFNVFAQYNSDWIRPKYCAQGDLYSANGKLIYSFFSNLSCEKALRQSINHYGNFCDSEKLINKEGHKIFDFDFPSHCISALEDLVKSGRGLFCDKADLHGIYYRIMVNFRFITDCKEAVLDAGRFRGLFCNDGMMMNYRGERIRDYTFNSRCRLDLPFMSRGF